MKVAIAGAGAVGRSIARELVENKHDVTLIERNAGHVDLDVIRLHQTCDLISHEQTRENLNRTNHAGHQYLQLFSRSALVEYQ